MSEEQKSAAKENRQIWLEAGMPQPYGTYQELYDDIRKFVWTYVDFLKRDIWYDVMTCWIIGTWRTEIHDVVSYLLYTGAMNSGKTRAIEVLLALCYRAILSPSMTGSTIYRGIEKWHPTLLCDEAQIYMKDDYADIVAIWNSGYRRGQYVLRTVRSGEDELDVRPFDVFGPKAMAAIENAPPTFRSRSFIFAMLKNRRKIPRKIDLKWAAQIRAKLHYLSIKLPTERHSTEEDLDLIPDNRLGELFSFILPYAPSREVVERLLEHAKELARVREAEDQSTVEGRIFRAMWDVRDQREHGKLAVKWILARLNEEASTKDQMTTRALKKVLASMGFVETRSSENYSAIYWDQERIAEFKWRYIDRATETGESGESGASGGTGAVTTQEPTPNNTQSADHDETVRKPPEPPVRTWIQEQVASSDTPDHAERDKPSTHEKKENGTSH
jgi:hypothetical protein